MLREATQMAITEKATPEEAVEMVVALMVTAIIPKEAVLEFRRLGGSNIEQFRRALRLSLDYSGPGDEPPRAA